MTIGLPSSLFAALIYLAERSAVAQSNNTRNSDQKALEVMKLGVGRRRMILFHLQSIELAERLPLTFIAIYGA
jgi:hypothetical protein